MLNKNIFTSMAFAGMALLASCAKEGPSGPAGLTGPSLTGSISGHVKLYDQYGSIVTLFPNNTSLLLDGGGTPAYYSDTTGYYIFGALAGAVTGALTTNNYYIVATDSGYGATALNNIQLVTGDLNVDIKLSAIPDSFVSTFISYYNAGSANDSLAFTFIPDTRARNCIVFANSSIAVNNQPVNYLWTHVVSIAPNATSGFLIVPGQDLRNVGMVSGQKVYYAAYSYVVNDCSAYEDLTTGKTVYNAVNATPIIDSATAP